MKVLVFSDLHFFRDRLPVLKETCDWILDRIVSYKPDVVVNCGDINHSHGYVEIDVLQAMTDFLTGVAEACGKAQFWMVSGNHDQASKDATTSILASLGKIPNVRSVVGSPEFPKGLPFGFCPYPPATEAKSSYFQRLSTGIASAKPNTLFTHWEVSGIPYRPADTIKNTSHAVPVSGLPLSMIVNGHYHHPTVYLFKPKVVIVGSPCYYNYADSIGDIPRGILIIDYSKGTPVLTREENPHGYLYDTVESANLPTWLESNAHQLDRVKLRIKLQSDSDYGECRDIIDEIKSLAKSVKIIGATKVAEEWSQDVAISLDATSAIRDYVTQRSGSESLVAIGTALIEEARCSSNLSE